MNMTATELALHDPYEGYPNRYNRYDITMEAFVRPEDGSDGPFVSTQLAGQAYIQTTQDNYVEPCRPYKIACCRTVMKHRLMLDPEADRTVALQIYNACNRELLSTFEYTMTDADIAAL